MLNSTRRVAACFLAVSLLVIAQASVVRGRTLAAEKSVGQLEEEFNREPSPKRRVTLALSITEAKLASLLSSYEGTDEGKVREDSAAYRASIERLDHAVQDPQLKGGTKEAEIGLRREIKELGNLRLNLSAAEQPPLDNLLMKVTQLHERILYSLMNLEKKR